MQGTQNDEVHACQGFTCRRETLHYNKIDRSDRSPSTNLSGTTGTVTLMTTSLLKVSKGLCLGTPKAKCLCVDGVGAKGEATSFENAFLVCVCGWSRG